MDESETHVGGQGWRLAMHAYIVVLMNLVVDIFYGVLDPRVRING